MTCDLWYWDGLPGRGEFVRLALEAGDIAYRDRGRDSEDALPADMARLRKHASFAPPYLITDGMVIGQTANILLYLGQAHGLAPADLPGRFWINQVQLTIADIVSEAHDTHHPVAAGDYYEDQKAEALRRSHDFRQTRMPKYLGWFDQALGREAWLSEKRWSYADLSLFQLVEGLRFAFPKRMGTLEPDYPALTALHDRVAVLPELQDYLSSDRRLPFGNGIFRRYPELDGE